MSLGVPKGAETQRNWDSSMTEGEEALSSEVSGPRMSTIAVRRAMAVGTPELMKVEKQQHIT